jgi:excisionase family DNA binding protein
MITYVRKLTVNELARLAGVVPATVRWWVAEGKLRARREGWAWHIDHADALQFLARPRRRAGRPRKGGSP